MATIPGVPALKIPFTQSLISAGAILVSDLVSRYFLQKWGIYDADGNLVLEPDSFVGMEYMNSWQISDYPVEQGSFASYNKVSTPFSSTVSMSKGGSESDRTAFLNAVDAMAGSLEPYSIITPEKTYINATVERYDYERRTHRGAGMIFVHLRLKEIRESAQIQYTNTRSGQQIQSSVPASAKTNTTTSTGVASSTDTKTPSAQATVNQGQVAPNAASSTTVAQSAAIL